MNPKGEAYLSKAEQIQNNKQYDDGKNSKQRNADYQDN